MCVLHKTPARGSVFENQLLLYVVIALHASDLYTSRRKVTVSAMLLCYRLQSCAVMTRMQRNRRCSVPTSAPGDQATGAPVQRMLSSAA